MKKKKVFINPVIIDIDKLGLWNKETGVINPLTFSNVSKKELSEKEKKAAMAITTQQTLF